MSSSFRSLLTWQAHVQYLRNVGNKTWEHLYDAVFVFLVPVANRTSPCRCHQLIYIDLIRFSSGQRLSVCLSLRNLEYF